MTITFIKVLLLRTILINHILLIQIQLDNVLYSMPREGVFQVLMYQEDTDNHLNWFLEVHPTKLVLMYPTKVIQLGITNSGHHYITSLILLPSLILINRLLLFIIKHVMR